MNLSHITHSAGSALIASLLMMALVLASFFILEPSVGRAQLSPQSDTFEVTQEITAEISFETPAQDVTMAPSIASLTGGSSYGDTYVVVNTNNATGYNMTIAFSSTTAMTRDGGGGVINNYAPASDGTPDYSFTTDTFAQFGYTVVASTTSELDQSFLDNASNACNQPAGTDTSATSTCWMDPDDTAEQIILTNSATPLSGSTTTIAFRVHVPANPSPAVPTGFYTATATLTATVN